MPSCLHLTTHLILQLYYLRQLVLDYQKCQICLHKQVPWVRLHQPCLKRRIYLNQLHLLY
ncbi:hypothetical protein RO3G_06593 [Rhizopus delemar RA 99-880]|uniref:Uncharacterized protein n=1 Tax=Rhizopus delemar (strain RA 99-880 / ATCC MYA-4621 / FGSC 9543 / NRRL 43880) TaxID=246409 RepID=I1C0A8_RHIO9|nr:hypothetical protein RO3G_06593 [Rhizopus delemar RA 99-880]|eukprot:EIE81888.1 hypothetical protein RO3G_06593 [Rhizopus delemar RA 99-880]